MPNIYDPVECNDLECGFMGPDSEIYGYCSVKCICKLSLKQLKDNYYNFFLKSVHKKHVKMRVY